MLEKRENRNRSGFMIQKPRVGSYVVFEPPEEGWENWKEQSNQINQLLHRMGVEVIKAPEPIKDLESMEQVRKFFIQEELDALHALIITWSFDHYTLELVQSVQKPVVIRAIPGIRTGSIVGAQQLSSVMADLGMEHRIFYGKIPDEAIIKKACDYFKACAISNTLKGSRLGVIGRRTEGMTPTAVDEVEVMRLYGIRLIHYGLDELNDISASIPEKEAEHVWKRFQTGAKKIDVKYEHGITTAKNYLACKKIIQEHQLDTLTIGSYPKCQGTMCLPIAWLNEEGFPVGCEGDVNATITMFVLSLLSDLPIHFGEMLEIDETENSIVTSHCGCGSPSLADDKGFVLTPVRLAHDGVSIRYAAKPGPVTFVNMVGRKGTYRMCAFEGNAVHTSMVFEGNPIKFKINTPIEKIWEGLDQHSFGHHWMTVYEHVTPVLREFCKLAGLIGFFPG